MEELIKQIVNKTGISEAQARSAAETVVAAARAGRDAAARPRAARISGRIDRSKRPCP